MPSPRVKPPQRPGRDRGNPLAGVQDTSGTTKGVQNTGATYAGSSAVNSGVGTESFNIETLREKAPGRKDYWTIFGTIAAWSALILTVLGLAAGAIWYLAKTDSALTSVQGEVKDVRVKVDKLSEDSLKQGVLLDGIEKSVSRIERSTSPPSSTVLERVVPGSSPDRAKR